MRGMIKTLFSSVKEDATKAWNVKNLDPAALTYLKTSQVTNNIYRVFAVTLFLLFFEITNLIMDIWVDKHPLYQMEFRIAVLSLLGVSIIFFFIVMRILQTEKKLRLNPAKWMLVNIFWYVIAFFILWFCTIELRECMGIINYLLLIVVFSVIPFFGFTYSFIFLLVVGGVQTATNLYYGANASFIQLCLMLAVCGFVVSQMHYISFVKNALAQFQIRHLAERDTLTGLLNRYGLKQWLKHSNLENQIVCCIFFDIDFFKEYNDTYGHIKGDACLKCIADVISSNFKSPQEAICRFGGDEIVVLRNGTLGKNMKEVFTEIQNSIEKLKIHSANQIVSHYVTISAGGAQAYISKNCDFWTVVDYADHALYDAKQSGRNRICLRENI